MAWLLGQKGLSVLLWGRDAEQIACIAAERVNRRYLPEARLPETVVPTTETAPLLACAVWVLALAFLVLIGFNLMGEGFGYKIPKGYTYFAMAFSLAVDVLNIKLHTRAKPPSSV